MLRPILMLALLTPAAQAQTLESRVQGLDITALSDLPFNPDADDCRDQFSRTPVTPGGRIMAENRWEITGELPFGDRTAVSFVGEYRGPSIQGRCRLIGGGVAFFAGDQLIETIVQFKIYQGQAVDNYDGRAIGEIRPLGDGGLRVFSGDFIPAPVADLKLDADGTLLVLPVATEDAVCDGAARVPNLYGLPMDQAHQALARLDWEPNLFEPPGQEAQDITAGGATVRGICSANDCSFRYITSAAELTVITVGDDPADDGLPPVVDYQVVCR